MQKAMRIVRFTSLVFLWLIYVCDSSSSSSSDVLDGSGSQSVDTSNGPIAASLEEEKLLATVHTSLDRSGQKLVQNDKSGNSIETKQNLLGSTDTKIPKCETIRKIRRRDSHEQLLKRKLKPDLEIPMVHSKSKEDLSSSEGHSHIKEVHPTTVAEEVGKESLSSTVIEEKVFLSTESTKQEVAPPSEDSDNGRSQFTSPDKVAEGNIPAESPAPSFPPGDDGSILMPSDQTQHAHSDAMPSFDEWKKMMLAEQEKGGHKVPLPGPPGKKIASQKRRRNYSSYECGAKIVSSNPESEGSSRILNEMVDEYMLNPCKAKISFIVELCESVQASQIELANFELFSSCPKDFSVFSSANYPTREWAPLGTFTAAEQRVLQNFQLKQEGFGKFIKIELLSHYGKEHYCPLSVVRIYGTSMVDEYEEMETLSNLPSPAEDELDRLDLPVEDKSSSNIFGSATDAVYNIVKKAAQVLGQHQTIEGEGDQNVDQNVSEPEQCKFINNTCSGKNITNKLTATDLFMSATSIHRSLFQHLRRCDQCVVSSRPSYYSVSQPQCRFFQAALGPVLFSAICDWFKDNLITLENVPIIDISDNTSVKVSKPTSMPPTVISVIIDHNKSELPSLPAFSDSQTSVLSEETVMQGSSSTTVAPKAVRILDSSTSDPSEIEINPTKSFSSIESGTLVEQSIVKTEPSYAEKLTDTVSVSLGEMMTSVPPVAVSVSNVSESVAPTPTDSLAPSVSNITKKSADVSKTEELVNDFEVVYSNESQITDNITTLDAAAVEDFSESVEEKLIDPRDSTLSPSATGSTVAQKESVFMRMNNRIKALELNMSLSSQYLQELSQRYRRQMEEMQRAFNRTIGTLNDTARKAAERDVKQQEVIGTLQSEVANLTQAVDQLLAKRSSLMRMVLDTHIFLIIVEAIIMITIMSLYVRRISFMLSSQVQPTAPAIPVPDQHSDLKRRNSIDSCCSSPTVKVKKRSVSEENIPTEENLLIVEPAISLLMGPPLKVKKRQRKKKGMQRSVSIPNMSPRKNSTSLKKKVSRDRTCAAGIIFSHAMPKILPNANSKHICENCNKDNVAHCCVGSNTCSSEKRLNAEPLKNLTNGEVEKERTCFLSTPKENLIKQRENKFSFKKFIKFQKRDSI